MNEADSSCLWSFVVCFIDSVKVGCAIVIGLSIEQDGINN